MVDNPTKTSWLPLIVLCFAQFLASADNVTLSIATQALMSDLHATLGQISTANTMYPLIAGTFMVAGGMLGCIWGWRMLFRIGCLIFILAEVGAFFSPSITVFTWGARLTAGIGGSLMIPAVFGLISSLYRQRQRSPLLARWVPPAVFHSPAGQYYADIYSITSAGAWRLLRLVCWRCLFYSAPPSSPAPIRNGRRSRSIRRDFC